MEDAGIPPNPAMAPNGDAPRPAGKAPSGFVPYRASESLRQGTCAVVRPTPLPKRPRGRWFFGFILIAASAAAGYHIWDSFFRYRAYGTATGRVVKVSPPWDGVVRSFHVREGDRVRQGQLLASVENPELQQRQAQLADELKMAQANLAAEVAKVKWESATRVVSQQQLNVAEYYEAWGKLLQEQAVLEELTVLLRRSTELHKRNAISAEEVEQVRFRRQGQEHKVEKLRIAVDFLKYRVQQTEDLLGNWGMPRAGVAEQGMDQFQPFLIKIQGVQAEMTRHQEKLARGQIYAATGGVVTKTHRFAGESCKASEPLVSVLEEGSLQVVLYVSQDDSARLTVGDEVKLVIDPHRQPVSTTVARLGDQFELAPENIKRHYPEGQRLLPVYLQPKDQDVDRMSLRIGGVVKLPY